MKKYGDLGSRGFALYHGDCLKVMPTIPAQSVDMVLADPP